VLFRSKPPKICEAWLPSDEWREASTVEPTLEETSVSEEGETLLLEDNQEVVEKFDEYVLEKWIPWQDKYKKYKEVHQQYSTVLQRHEE